MNAQVLRRLHIRHAPILDQAHCLKLELSRELPPLHDAPPVPSKHLTRCLRNRVQATVATEKQSNENGPNPFSPILPVSLLRKWCPQFTPFSPTPDHPDYVRKPEDTVRKI